MKKTLILASFAALALAAGCASSTKSDSSGNMGVVGDSKKGCCQKSEGGSMGVVSEKQSCEDKSRCNTGGACPMQGKGDKQN